MNKTKIVIFAVIITVIIGILISIRVINRENNYLEFNSDGVLLTYTVSPTYGEIDKMYDKTTKIYNDGKIEIIHDNQIIESFHIDEMYIISLQSTIARVNFMELDENVSTESEDGDYFSITVNTKTETHTSNGLNPVNKRFCTLQTTIKDIVAKNH